MKKKSNYKLTLVVLCIVTAILIDITCFSHNEHIVFTLNDFRMYGLDLQQDGAVITTNTDPNINLDLPEPIYVKNIEIVLDEPLTTELQLQTFYVAAFADYTEENSVCVLATRTESKFRLEKPSPG